MSYNYTPPPPPRTRPVNWADLVKRAEGEDWNKPEPAYEFSQDRKFNDSGSTGGIYTPS